MYVDVDKPNAAEFVKMGGTDGWMLLVTFEERNSASWVSMTIL